MSISCQFRYCKALLFLSLTLVSSAIASVLTFNLLTTGRTYTCLQFLQAVSHSVGAHSSVLCEERSDPETEDAAQEDAEDNAEQPESPIRQYSLKSVSYRLVMHVLHIGGAMNFYLGL